VVPFAYAVALYDDVGTFESRAGFTLGASGHPPRFFGRWASHFKGQGAFTVRQYSERADTRAPSG